MKTKTLVQIFLSVAILSFGIWVFYDYKTSFKKQSESKKFLIQNLEEVLSIQIKKPDQNLKIEKRENQNWYITEPVKDLASFTEISRWFEEIKNQTTQKITSEGEINLKDYYLDDAPIVEINFSKNEKLIFSVSTKSSFDGKYFIKKGEELFIGEKYFFSEVNNKEFDTFRSKKILPPLGHAEKIQIKGKENFTLNWKDYKWSMDKNTIPLDTDRLDNFWTDMNSLEVSSSKEKLTKSSLIQRGFNKAQFQIFLSYPNSSKKYTLKFSPFQQDKVFVYASHRNFILEISKQDLEKIILSKKDIQDHSFPFKYNKNSVSQVKLNSEKKQFSFKKSGKDWMLANKQTVNTQKMNETLDKIQNLRGEKYKKISSIKNIKRSIEITNIHGDVIFELKELSDSGSYSWIKTNLSKDLVAVSKSSIDKIFNEDFFIKEQLKSK